MSAVRVRDLGARLTELATSSRINLTHAHHGIRTTRTNGSVLLVVTVLVTPTGSAWRPSHAAVRSEAADVKLPTPLPVRRPLSSG